MKGKWIRSLLGGLMLTAMCQFAAADTPTPTPTSTEVPTPMPTVTVSPTYTVPQRVVSLNHNRFNPEAGETVRVVGLRPDHGIVTIRIFTQSGVLIRRLVDHQELGYSEPVWDGKNEQGEMVASGVYIVVASGTKLHKRFRIAVLK